jgi:hypothetical protein
MIESAPGAADNSPGAVVEPQHPWSPTMPSIQRSESAPASLQERQSQRAEILAAIRFVSDLSCGEVALPLVRPLFDAVCEYFDADDAAEAFAAPVAGRVFPPEHFQTSCQGIADVGREIGNFAKCFGAAHLVDGTEAQRFALESASADLARVALFVAHHFPKRSEP